MQKNIRYAQTLEEINGILEKIDYLIHGYHWETLLEITNLIKLLGEEIGSNGISTDEDVLEIWEIQTYDISLFREVLKENLNILKTEYTELLSLPNTQSGVIKEFRYSSMKMAILRSNNSITCLFEDKQVIEESIKKIPDSTQIVILLGTGTKELYNELLQKYEVIGIEPCERINEIQEDNILKMSDFEFYEKLKNTILRCVGIETSVVLHPHYKNVHQISDILKKIKKLLNNTSIELNTRAIYAENWYKEAFLNQKILRNKIDKIVNFDNLHEKHKGEHALMIAGGPSLEDAIPYLKKFQHFYRIIAIGQTLKVLIKNDIIPDYVVSIDTKEDNHHFFKGIENKTPLVFPLQLNHNIVQNSTGVLIPLSDTPLNSKLVPFIKTTSFSASTVAISAVMFSYHLGFETIGLIGQDLALKGESYYSESVKRNSLTDGQLSEVMYDVELNNGEFGKTTPILLSFLENYKNVFKIIKNLEDRMYNTSEYGAKIGNVKYKSLDDILMKLKKDKLVFESSEFISDIEKKQFEENKDHIFEIFNILKNQLKIVNKKLRRKLDKNVVTINEYKLIVKEWEKIIFNKEFDEYLVPLKLAQFIHIQNKIRVIDIYKSTNSNRIEVIYLMENTMKNLIELLEDF